MNVLEDMNKANLVLQGPRRIGRKRSTELTTRGKEIAAILQDLDDFKSCYLNIVKYYRNNHLDVTNEFNNEVLNNILRSRKWEEDDIRFSRYASFEALFSGYRTLFIETMLDIVHYRSLKITNKYKINLQSKNNEIIKSIFEGILLDVITFVYGNFLTAQGTKKDNRIGKELEINEWIKSQERRFSDMLGGYSNWSVPFFAMDEVRKISFSFLKLVDPSKEVLQEEAYTLQEMIENDKKHLTAKRLEHVATNCVLEVVNEQIRKS